MYDLPNQTLQDWERTLDQMVKMPITHLSLYNLTIEPNTAFFKQRKRLQPLLPEDEVSKEMFLMAIDKMTSNGFDHYEISAFCKDNLYSLHNIGYWLGRTFLGLGPSAFSYHQGKRFQNVSSISQYKSMLKSGQLAHSFTEELEPEHKIRELFTIQLRLRAGIPIAAFESNFGIIPLEIKEALLDFENLGWIVNSLFHPQLTQEGILFYDTIAERLI
jgi:oxygen-independent coproporphyrinogen-3 oxidase